MNGGEYGERPTSNFELRTSKGGLCVLQSLGSWTFDVGCWAFAALRRFRSERGQALVEYAIVFPLQLMMTLAIIQLAQIFVAKQVVEYAAYCGARAKLVGLDNETTSFCWEGTSSQLNGAQVAALIPLSGICSNNANETNVLSLPGWGNLPGYGTASDPAITTVNFQTVNSSTTSQSTSLPGVYCNITFNYPLVVPVGNIVAYQIGQVFLGVDTAYLTTVNSQPCLVMTASCVLPNPTQ